MTGELPEGLEKHVFDTIRGAFKSRELLEAERPAHAPPYTDDGVIFQNWTTLVERQGVLLAELSVMPATKADLMERMPGLVALAPAWVKAEVHDEPMTMEQFALGLAQTVTEHREAIERVVAEQVIDPTSIDKALAKAPLPLDRSEESGSDLLRKVADVLTAHLKALADIAYDLETRF